MKQSTIITRPHSLALSLSLCSACPPYAVFVSAQVPAIVKAPNSGPLWTGKQILSFAIPSTKINYHKQNQYKTDEDSDKPGEVVRQTMSVNDATVLIEVQSLPLSFQRSGWVQSLG
jgi:hypothetical protein